MRLKGKVKPKELKEIVKAIRDVERKQMPFATSLALNKTGEDVLEENKRLMERVFERPTRWTLNSFFLRRSNKKNLEAVIERKTMAKGRFYLEVQEDGGSRKQTGIERLLIGQSDTGEAYDSVVPARGARLNTYGNVPGTQIKKALVDLGRKSATGQASKGKYFTPKGGGLSPGVWLKKGKRLTKFLSFTRSRPRYEGRFPMQSHGRKVAARVIERNYREAFRRAMATRKR